MPALRKKPAARDPAVRMARFAALRALANRLYGTATGRLRWLLITLIVGLAGCATSGRTPDPMPPVYVSERTWWQVDSDILAASRAAMIPAGNDARRFMENWRSRVHKRGEADFIPWFTGYWTQQWLAIKVAWYKLGAGEGKDPAAQRLAAYLQEQYRERVLEPVAREINPEVIRAKATQRYVRLLGEQLQAIPRRYGVPPEQFDRRLEDIPAIALAPPAAHNASLYQVVHADPLDTLPRGCGADRPHPQGRGWRRRRAFGCPDIASSETGQRETGGQARHQRWRQRCRGGGRRCRRRGDLAGALPASAPSGTSRNGRKWKRSFAKAWTPRWTTCGTA
jgi:hypothetical protein